MYNTPFARRATPPRTCAPSARSSPRCSPTSAPPCRRPDKEILSQKYYHIKRYYHKNYIKRYYHKNYIKRYHRKNGSPPPPPAHARARVRARTHARGSCVAQRRGGLCCIDTDARRALHARGSCVAQRRGSFVLY